MNVLLDLESMDFSKEILEIGDKFAFGGMMLGIGMLAVFAVLCILWGALVLFKIAFYDLPAKKKAEEAPIAPTPATPVVMPAPVANEDEELIAVFAAAIAMAESECQGAKFRVVSFRRK